MNRRIGKKLKFVMLALTFISVGFILEKSSVLTVDGDTVSGVIDGHEYVDLGLPSGTLWATCNVGADSPEKCGGGFLWGITKTMTEAEIWDTISSCNYIYLYKYQYGDINKMNVLQSEDDVAQVHWGGSWRMPTLNEMTELEIECKWVWTSLDGISGYNVKGRNGNSIFLPVTTIYSESDSGGLYMTSTRTVAPPYYSFGFNYLSFDSCFHGINGDFLGAGAPLYVRPVHVLPVNIVTNK